MNTETSKGPRGYNNWKSALNGATAFDAFEVALYSDIHIVGEIPPNPPCPYAFLNALPTIYPGKLAHCVTLRAEMFLDPHAEKIPSMTATDTSMYHGGSIWDEIGALTSLLMGARIRAGDVIRHFHPGLDPRGMPQADRNVPTLPPRRKDQGWHIPRALESKNLNYALLPLISTYPDLSPCDAVALVRAARLYQDALWVAEVEPELAWLFLVSAIEAPATAHHIENSDAITVLKRCNPELVSLLAQRNYPDLLQEVAGYLLPLVRTTNRFIDFVIKFLPSPPENRPHENLQLNWEPAVMKRVLSKIYSHRSQALHVGTPFPKPMCELPSIPTEIPIGLATSANGGVWVKEDTPMLLHTFEYLTQGVLLNWWNSLVMSSDEWST